MEKKRKKKPSANREFAVVTYLFLGIFLAMMAYLIYFQVVKSEDFINSPYNKRQDSFATRIVRGEIRSADDKVLAQTQVDEAGNETRVYPYGSLYAHVVGFATNGKAGLESTMNFNLLRSHDFVLERIVNELKGEKSMGDTVVTTLDSRLQEAAYNTLGSYKGAVMVMEPSTGKILAMVSKPDFDPNTIAQNWDALISEDAGESVLLNRATQGMYPPGSTFKILTTLEYIRENPNYNEFTYHCNGGETYGETTIHCYGNQAHGDQDLKAAFANSCNSAYASIGLGLDKDKFAALCNSLLFNQELPGTLGAKPSSFSLNASTGASLMMQTAIGQGETLVSPYHMLLIASAIANDGVLMKPYLVDHTQNQNGVEVKKYETAQYGEFMTGEEAALLQEYMSAVVTNGTGAKLAGTSYHVAGKTGSAEFSSNKNESHSWFVGYAGREEKPEVAIVVVGEGAGTGSAVAVPAARQILDIYFSYAE